jgi:hypothetical protein
MSADPDLIYKHGLSRTKKPKLLADRVPADPEGCIVLRNRKGIAAKCRTPLDRDCRACPVWLAMKEEKTP